jgi:hypothetical protein
MKAMFGLSSFVGYFRSSMSLRCMQWINRLSGAVLMAFGFYLILRLLTSSLAPAATN